jgi:ABC-type branched-subunit amino acid transport system substrate-binding protein
MAQQGEQCIGITDGAFTFAEGYRLAEVLGLVKVENDRVLAEGMPTVSITYVVPLPDDPDDSLAVNLRHELQGVQLAQYRANRTAELGGTPAIRILVANVGNRSEQWSAIVPQIVERTTGSDRVVAVAGLGQSLDTTRQLIRDLSSARIPMVATRLTADNLSTAPVPSGTAPPAVPGLFRIAPTNYNQVDAVAGFLKQSTVPPLLVQDRNPTDPYVTSLGDRFLTALKEAPAVTAPDPERFDSSLGGVENAFVSMLRSICARQSSVLYFAGRGDDLGPFVSAASARSCPDHALTILTGDDGVDLAEDLHEQLDTGNTVELAAALNRNIGLRYTALAHPAAWADTATFLPAATAAFDSCPTCFGGQYGDEDLDDGAAIVGYDSILVTVRAIRDGVSQTNPDEVTTGTVQQQLYRVTCTSPVPGASGPIAFDGDGRAVGKPVPVLELVADGTVSLVQVAKTPGC